MPGLIDTTLREGAQAPVGYLDPGQQQEVLAGVLRIGVEEVEIGHTVAEGAYDPEPVADLLVLARELDPGVRRALWCRARADDIRAAAALRPDVVSFALPVSDLHLSRRLGRSHDWALAQVGRLVGIARDAGVGYLSVGCEDASRADPGFLAAVLRAARTAGADRVRLADTVGIAEPGEVVALVELARRWFDGDVGVHLHDDFGMATAGAVAALQTGADWADVSLTGLGERAGISRTEEVAGWYVARCGADYDLRAARDLARRLAGWVGRPVPPQAPVVGTDLFTCESGLHLAGLVADPATYEPYPPDLVGATRAWRLGRGAGRAAVAGLIGADGEPVAVTARVRRAAVARGRALTVQECAELLAAPVGSAGPGPTEPAGRQR